MDTQQPLKIFINECNTYLAQALVEELRNDHVVFEN